MKLTIEKTDGTKVTFEGEVSEIERIAKEVVKQNLQVRLVPYYLPYINPQIQPIDPWPGSGITWIYPTTISSFTPNWGSPNYSISETNSCYI